MYSLSSSISRVQEGDPARKEIGNLEQMLVTEEANVCTIEDPIEIVEETFNQIQVQENIDLNLPQRLVRILRPYRRQETDMEVDVWEALTRPWEVKLPKESL